MTSFSFSRRLLLAGVAAATAAGALSGCGGGSGDTGGGAGGETYDWDMTITVGNTSTWYEGAEEFATQLNELSDGRITLNLFTNEQLSGGDPAAGIEMLQRDEKAFSYNSTIIYAGLDERFGAVNAPFLYSSYEEWDATSDSAAKAYEQLCADMDIKFLGFAESGMRQVTNNTREIKTPDDLKGLKIRVPGITLFQDTFQTMGANPTTMNFSEVFTALQQGTIDGQENPVDVTHSSGITEVQKYQTMWNYVYDPLILGMSLQLWDSLSPEDQDIVQEAATKANEFQIDANREREAKDIEEMSEKMTVTELSPAELEAFRAAMAGVYDQYQSRWTDEVVTAVQPK